LRTGEERSQFMEQDYKNLISQLKYLEKPPIEKNIFSIGGRGHYENPISDILAFFCDLRAEHGFGDLVLRAIFNAADIGATIPYLQIVSPPQREYTTNKRKRMDLVIEGNNWVLVIENKIKHKVDNPLDHYAEHVKSKYPDKDIHFILLSIKPEPQKEPWANVLYERLFDEVTKLLRDRYVNVQPNKWLVILREFLINIKQIIGDVNMEPIRRDFVSQNYEDIQQLVDMQAEYLEFIATEIESIVNAAGLDVTVKKEDWGPMGYAFRIDSTSWKGCNTIALRVTREGTLRLRIYDYTFTLENFEELDRYFNHSDIVERWNEPEGNPRTRGYEFSAQQNISSLDKTLEWAANKIQHKNESTGQS